MSDENGPFAPASELDELERQLHRGFLHAHTRLSANHSDLLQVASTVYAVIDTLVERGVVTLEEVEGRMRAAQQRLADGRFAGGLGFVMQAAAADEQDAGAEVPVDCAARRPLCRSACCALDVPLAQSDVAEGVLRWDLGHPYYLRRDSDRYCHHLQRPASACTEYERRPSTCRRYTCADDARIWRDFEARVPNTEGIGALLNPHGEPRRVGLERMSIARSGKPPAEPSA